MSEKKVVVTAESGARATAYITPETIRFSGEERIQDVPRSDDDYRYTHGGGLYRAAVERVWKEYYAA